MKSHGSVFRLDNRSHDEVSRSDFDRTWALQAVQELTYQVRLTADVLDPDNPVLIRAGASHWEERPRRVVVVDTAVAALYGDEIDNYFTAHNAEYHFLPLDSTEDRKRMYAVHKVIDELARFGVDRRREPLIAIGGGVLMDVAAFAASVYRRSTPYVRVPTTLIGLVDAGVGAKTGVNHGPHKNRVGTYFPACETLCDRAFLATLDRRHVVNGMAEILKIALVKDARLFTLLEEFGVALIQDRFQGRDEDKAAAEVLYRAIDGMLEELAPNLWEHQLERVVDYGHGISPALEMRALPELLHGEAVNIDMALTTMLGVRRGLVSAADADRILALMRSLELPIAHPLCEPELFADALADVVRHRDGRQRLPLPVGIGDACFVNDVSVAELADAARSLGTEAARA
jgi:2-epi-5-epi-valiolone synthase